MKRTTLYLLIAMGMTIILQPFSRIGAHMGPGWSEILNGGVAFLLLCAVGISALTGRAKPQLRK